MVDYDKGKFYTINSQETCAKEHKIVVQVDNYVQSLAVVRQPCKMRLRLREHRITPAKTSSGDTRPRTTGT